MYSNIFRQNKGMIVEILFVWIWLILSASQKAFSYFLILYDTSKFSLVCQRFVPIFHSWPKSVLTTCCTSFARQKKESCTCKPFISLSTVKVLWPVSYYFLFTPISIFDGKSVLGFPLYASNAQINQQTKCCVVFPFKSWNIHL